MAVPVTKIKLAEEKETRQLKVENQYLKKILNKLYRIIIVGEATLQKELKPPEEIKNDQQLIELTINIEKVTHKFYELQTELDYIHKKLFQLSSVIDGDESNEGKSPPPERTNKFTAVGRKPRGNPTQTTGQLDRSLKLDKDLEFVTSTMRDMKEKENTGFLYWLLSPMTWTSGDERQPVTQQSNDEMHVNLFKEQDPIDNAATDERKRKLKAAEYDNVEKQMTIRSQENIIAQLRSRISALENEVEVMKKKRQCPPTRKGFFASISGWMSGLKTWNSVHERQPLTQQSDDEMASNLITNGQEELHFRIFSLEHQLEEVKKEKQMLLTRLSQISSMQLTEGNPNIADLSDPNRPVKVAEQFSELYDNRWTDSFQVLHEGRGQKEEAAITVLLKIILRVYEVCRSYAENQNSQIIKSMCMFTGVKVGESIIRESMHSLRNFRAKNFSYAMTDIKKIIEESLPSMIGSEVYIYCQDYIAECTKICWLMCIKSPPMYISAGTTDKFDHSLYTSYTKTGKHVSYVVWPTLFQYENGPIMKKGVAQGTN